MPARPLINGLMVPYFAPTCPGLPLILEEDNGALIISCIAVASLLTCLICALCHRKRKYTHHQRQFTLNRNIAQFEPNSELINIGTALLLYIYRTWIHQRPLLPHLPSGLNSSRRQLQLSSGSNNNLPTIPPIPLPPKSSAPLPPPPHICITSPSRLSNGGLYNNNDDEDEDDLQCATTTDSDHNNDDLL